MKTNTNILECEIIKNNIDNDFVIVKLETANNKSFLSYRMLDSNDFNFNSTFFSRNFAYVMMTKDAYKDFKCANLEDNLEYIKCDLHDLRKKQIVQLFINALCNKDETYNNLTGSCIKLYKSSKNKIEVLDYHVDEKDNKLYLWCTKSNYKTMTNKDNKLKPFYELADDFKSLKRSFKIEKGIHYYIKDSDNNEKNISFLNTKDGSGRSYEMVKIIADFNNYFGKYIRLSFKEVEILEKHYIDENDIDDLILSNIHTNKYALIDMINDNQYDDYLNDLYKNLKDYGLDIVKKNKIQKERYNIVFIYDKDHYKKNPSNDPHDKLIGGKVVQCITPNSIGKLDLYKKTFTPQLNTIFKEMLIKNNTFNEHCIQLIDWKKFGFDGDWIFVYKMKLNNKNSNKSCVFFKMIIGKNGEFSIHLIDYNLFNSSLIDECTELFDNYKDGEFLVLDDKGNKNIVSRTNFVTMPLSSCLGKQVSRSKDSKEINLSGLLDVNYFKIDNKYYYNAGTKSDNPNQSFSNASHLYEINMIDKSENIVKKMFELMTVTFVKYNDFTVLPFPIKMLKEYGEKYRKEHNL